MKISYRSTAPALALCLSFVLPVIAQESDNPPVLKLDRVPSSPAFLGQTRAPAAPRSAYSVETVIGGLSAPWAMAFLPSGEMLINEYSGAMRILDSNGRLSEPLAGLPEMSHEGWAGLFDVALDPGFSENQLVYFSYTGNSGNQESPNVPRVARGRLDRETLPLDDVEILIDGIGSQEIHFAPNGQLLVSGAANVRGGNSQDLSVLSGKSLRINPDGSIPNDNPWSSDSGVMTG